MTNVGEDGNGLQYDSLGVLLSIKRGNFSRLNSFAEILDDSATLSKKLKFKTKRKIHSKLKQTYTCTVMVMMVAVMVMVAFLSTFLRLFLAVYRRSVKYTQLQSV